MAATEGVITVGGWIWDTCDVSFKTHIVSGWCLSFEALVATPVKSIPRRGPARLIARVTRAVQDAPARGDLVCSELVGRSLRQAREEDGLQATATVTTRQTLREVKQSVANCVRNVEIREYSGASLGDDGRTHLIYLLSCLCTLIAESPSIIK